MQICLTGGIQEDNCALGSQSCWHNDSLSVSACIDTYRGYKCKCPEGASHFTKPLKFAQLMLVMQLSPQCLPCRQESHCGRDFSCSKGCGHCCKDICRAPVQCPFVAPAPVDLLDVTCYTFRQLMSACAIGWRGNGQQCEDINECLEGAACDHTCINLPGSYRCECDEGFNLVSEAPKSHRTLQCKIILAITHKIWPLAPGLFDARVLMRSEP